MIASGDAMGKPKAAVAEPRVGCAKSAIRAIRVLFVYRVKRVIDRHCLHYLIDVEWRFRQFWLGTHSISLR